MLLLEIVKVSLLDQSNLLIGLSACLSFSSDGISFVAQLQTHAVMVVTPQLLPLAWNVLEAEYVLHELLTAMLVVSPRADVQALLIMT